MICNCCKGGSPCFIAPFGDVKRKAGMRCLGDDAARVVIRPKGEMGSFLASSTHRDTA